ncbi:SH2 domain-containing protein 4A-like isoform X2 [Thrips palmi]|nr:SH2 domain-containing protein 4A-like isoform X2 [Thrips palmi]XP_034249101.1 SH2 domain-containing protein 4A-like isoform X2 [Thrips palmi]XP_034249109.1 SH2 domain-containing protein 4A-like isoform X2 [Thrips palmi]
MLQQILQDMWVDPAILAELDDDQKQTLFCKMREEQVRRWRQWDQKLSDHPSPPRPRRNSSKTVQFLNGPDGEPWVWVMGEHPDDLPIEQILELEAREKARQQAELEAQQLRLSELTDLLDLSHKQIQEMEADRTATAPPCAPHQTSVAAPTPPAADDPSEMIYCSVDELREWSKKKEEENKSAVLGHNAINSLKNNNNLSNAASKLRTTGRPDRDVLHEISLNNKPAARVPKVAQRVAQWERRVLETRTEQILTNLKQRQEEAAREAEEMAPAQERLWQEQERRAKEAEQQIREIARRAREEHRRSSVLGDPRPSPTSPMSPTLPSPTASAPPTVPPPPPPQSREAVLQWYRTKEEPQPRRAGLDASGAPHAWFHGLISRHEAEARLASRGPGAFLVRLSERVWGYAISYRDRDASSPPSTSRRCKHYLVDTTGPGGGYQFLGANQICHKSLEDLVRYHRENPITLLGGERLLEACPRPPSSPSAPSPPSSAPASAPASAPVPLAPLSLPPLPARPLPPIPVTSHQRPVFAGGARLGRNGP